MTGMKDARAIFRFLLDADARGERAALVTITDIIGSSSRAPGTHMAVAEDGSFLGSFSGGCVEAAVVGEAQRVIACGKAARIRFGPGSQFIDIKLPCGGGIEFLILPQPPHQVIQEAWAMLSAREAVTLRMTLDGNLTTEPAGEKDESCWEGDIFVTRHIPDLRLIALGHGAEVQAFAALGRAYGVDVTVLSPEEAIVERAIEVGANAFVLKTPGRSPHLIGDRHTAMVFLFHDHDWEMALLAQALEQDALYVGAMGSRQTQARRLTALVEHGVPAARAERVVGPIGLIPATRDPDTLALSVLAQIVGRQQQCGGR
jgi:xanthine dehydrogenase accessory factor